jgi:hypothetical protein
MRIIDTHGQVLWEEVSSPGGVGRPEVDRPTLRAMLLDSLQPGTVHWGHGLTKIVTPMQGSGQVYRLCERQSVPS